MQTKANARDYIEKQFSTYGYNDEIITSAQRLFELEYDNRSIGSRLSVIDSVVMALLLKYHGITSEIQGGLIGGWNEKDQCPFGTTHCWLKVKGKIIDFGIWADFASRDVVKLDHPLIFEDITEGSEESGIIGPGVFSCQIDKSSKRVFYQNTGFSALSSELPITHMSVTKYIMQCPYDLVISRFCYAAGIDYSYRNRELVIELSEGMYFRKADNTTTITETTEVEKKQDVTTPQKPKKPKRTKLSAMDFEDVVDHTFVSDKEQKAKKLFADVDGRFNRITTPVLRLDAESYLAAMELERGEFQALMRGNPKYVTQFEKGALYILNKERENQ